MGLGLGGPLSFLLAFFRMPDQHIYGLGLNQEITDRFSLEISASRLEASTDSGNDYENLVFSAALAITL